MKKLFPLTLAFTLICGISSAQFTKYGTSGDYLYGSHVTKTKSAKDYVMKLKPVNTAIGTGLIGVSVAAYAISSSMISDKLKDETDADKIESLNNTRSAIGYVCGGVSLVGVVVFVTGLHKEYVPNKGVPLSNNLYFDSRNSGVSLSFTF
ncbi:MAG: hypothetical protein LBU95_02410 [Rikenellaceae bacterium]|jgi:hypothetical protein|nr:hypothetical protein [Rikenellaceae bacterium]